jgi:hypothetical protein
MSFNMYLDKVKKGSEYNSADGSWEDCEGKTITPSTVVCWNKAFSIHKWFEEHCIYGENSPIPVKISKDSLETLLYFCEETEKIILNANDSKDGLSEDTIQQLLEFIPPTQAYLFISNTNDYSWYKQDIKDTIVAIKSLLKHTDFNKETIYYISG